MKKVTHYLLVAWLSCVIAGCSHDSGYYSSEARPATGSRFAEPAFNTEEYDPAEPNRFISTAKQPLSTFSVDVDTASYTNVRRLLNQGKLPPAGAVRIEEMVNYFPYDYRPPTQAAPLSVDVEITAAPWQPEHRLARIALRGKELPAVDTPASNLVFLLDVSGSMHSHDKLPLVFQAIEKLTWQLGPRDRVAIVVYAGAAGLLLPSTEVTQHGRKSILRALRTLEAGGSTNGGEGIMLAYGVAQKYKAAEGNNRVILCTDGDFNVGVTNRSDLVELIQKNAKQGVDLTILAFGKGNLQEATMEELTNKGNGNYHYIDSAAEIEKVLGAQLGGTLFVIARDVKIQVDFNPSQVQAYRLIGYENRLLAEEDFNDDRKDAGDIGSGHTVTALYEIIPPGVKFAQPEVEPSKYKQTTTGDAPPEPGDAISAETLTVRVRYKLPGETASKRMDLPATDGGGAFVHASGDTQFAAAVAAYGMILRKSKFVNGASLKDVREWASDNLGDDPQAYRAGFVELVDKASKLQNAE